MPKIDPLKSFIFALVLGSLFAACRDAPPSPPPPAPEYFFPSDLACTYPAKAPGNTFRRLGGGDWAPVDTNAPVPSYICSGSNGTVQLYGDERSSVNIGYKVSGVKAGGTTIELTYVAESEGGPVPNESTNRNVFTTLCETVARESLGAAPPELFRRKMMNLSSYSKPGSGSPENFDLGPGFLLLTREAAPEGGRVLITLKLFSDVALKLKR